MAVCQNQINLRSFLYCCCSVNHGDMNIIPYLIIAILPYFVFFISLFTLAILVSLLSNRKCQHICFCLESFLKTIEYFSFTATAIFTTRLLNSLVSFNKYFLFIIQYNDSHVSFVIDLQFHQTRFIWSPVTWFAVRMDWPVSTCCGFLLRCFFIRVVLILIHKFSCVKKFNCAIITF